MVPLSLNPSPTKGEGNPIQFTLMQPELQHAARVLRQGGIVAYPTEYCFGLGCDPRNRNAVFRLLRIKHRAVSKGLIVLGADVDQLTPYVQELPKDVLKTWPGPYTWLVSPRIGTPAWITGGEARIAARVTAHRPAAALCRAAGMAIVSTSANRTGETPARMWREVLRRFGAEIDVVLSGRVGRATAPTPIRDALTGVQLRG
jgi:L-threonylcarbamoyladenylate synthase